MSLKLPSLSLQEEDIASFCAMFDIEFDLYYLPQFGSWFWAMVANDTHEPVHLGKDRGYILKEQALRAAYMSIWPGREAYGH